MRESNPQFVAALDAVLTDYWPPYSALSERARKEFRMGRFWHAPQRTATQLGLSALNLNGAQPVRWQSALLPGRPVTLKYAAHSSSAGSFLRY